jgi:Subunit CCDC53 of WASH complex
LPRPSSVITALGTSNRILTFFCFKNNDRQIKAVPIQKTILAVNNFIVNTTTFLNDFSQDCEGKFMKISSRITDLETLLMIFEAKLNSFSIEEHSYGKSSADPGPISGTGAAGVLSSSHDYHDRDDNRLGEGNAGESIPSSRTGDAGYTGDPDGYRSSPPSGGHGSAITEPSLRPPPPPPGPPPPAPPVSVPFLSASTVQMDGSHGTHQSNEGEFKGTDRGVAGGEGTKAKEHPDYIGYFKMMKVPYLPRFFAAFYESIKPTVSVILR